MLTTIKAGLVAAKAFAIANAPLGLFIGGLVVGVAAIVSVAKSATAANADMEKHADALEQIADELKNESISEEDKEEVRIEKKKEVKATVADFFHYYWKSLLLITISGGLLVGGFLWQSKRFAVAAATAATQAALIKTMETNIQKTYGDKAVIAMQDPNWDPSILRKKENSDPEAKGLEGYDDPYRDYKITNSDLTRSLYLINRHTMDPTKFRVACTAPYSSDFSVQDIVDTLICYQAEFNKKLHASGGFMSEQTLMNDLGYLIPIKNKAEWKRTAIKGWFPEDRIDFGLNDIIRELGNCDPAYMNELNAKYREGVPIKLNSSYGDERFEVYNPYVNRRAVCD